MLRSFAALGLSTAIRVLAGFALFILMARHWGAVRFGEFMYLFSVAALLVQVCEYGFTQQILREVGKTPERATEHMGNYLSAKLWLTLMTWLLGGVVARVSGLDAMQALTLALLLLAGTFMSFGDFLLTCFRAVGRYGKETVVTLQGNLLYIGFGVAAIYSPWGALGVAAALAIARLGHLLLVGARYRRYIPGTLKIDWTSATIVPVLREGLPYGLSVALATAFVNLDTVLVTHVLGFAQTGVYQAAARFYQGAALLPPIFAGLFLPRLSRMLAEPQAFARAAGTLNMLMLLAGCLLLGIFWAGSHYYHWIYPDPSLAPVQLLLPAFGLLALLNLVAASQGIIVTALGGQSYRATVTLAALVLMVGSAYPLMRSHGPIGMVFACSLGYGLVFVAFWLWSEKHGIRNRKVMLPTAAAVASLSIMIGRQTL